MAVQEGERSNETTLSLIVTGFHVMVRYTLMQRPNTIAEV